MDRYVRIRVCHRFVPTPEGDLAVNFSGTLPPSPFLAAIHGGALTYTCTRVHARRTMPVAQPIPPVVLRGRPGVPVEVVQGNALDMPFTAGELDLVVSRQALHFFDD
jgi:hypothetical protein